MNVKAAIWVLIEALPTFLDFLSFSAQTICVLYLLSKTNKISMTYLRKQTSITLHGLSSHK